MISVFSASAILVLWFFDVQYYLRILGVLLLGRILPKKEKITDPVVLYGFCFTQDIDVNLGHLNNARYVRELDFARFHFYDRSGLYAELSKVVGIGDILQVATNIRYRKTIPIFTFYKIVTQLLYWDEKSIYIEHKFITNDGFVRAIVLSKQTICRLNLQELMPRLLPTDSKPKELPQELELWMKSIEVSSLRLRPKAD